MVRGTAVLEENPAGLVLGNGADGVRLETGWCAASNESETSISRMQSTMFEERNGLGVILLCELASFYPTLACRRIIRISYSFLYLGKYPAVSAPTKILFRTSPCSIF